MTHILIVDDSVSVRKALEITLRNNSLTSSSAVSGEQAVEMLEKGEESYDLLMVDVIMPGMSGLEFCQKLKDDGRYEHLPVILMSGNVDDDMRNEARLVKADGVLRKPFKSEDLIPMVEGLLASAAKKRPQIQEEEDKEESVSVEAPETTEKLNIDYAHLDALNHLLQTYEDHPRVRDVVVLDREGNPIKQTGNMLPDNIQVFARFFTNTAGVLGKQMLGQDIDDVTIRYGDHEMVVHNLPGHFVIVLMGAQEKIVSA